MKTFKPSILLITLITLGCEPVPDLEDEYDQARELDDVPLEDLSRGELAADAEDARPDEFCATKSVPPRGAVEWVGLGGAPRAATGELSFVSEVPEATSALVRVQTWDSLGEHIWSRDVELEGTGVRHGLVVPLAELTAEHVKYPELLLPISIEIDLMSEAGQKLESLRPRPVYLEYQRGGELVMIPQAAAAERAAARYGREAQLDIDGEVSVLVGAVAPIMVRSEVTQ